MVSNTYWHLNLSYWDDKITRLRIVTSLHPGISSTMADTMAFVGKFSATRPFRSMIMWKEVVACRHSKTSLGDVSLNIEVPVVLFRLNLYRCVMKLGHWRKAIVASECIWHDIEQG